MNNFVVPNSNNSRPFPYKVSSRSLFDNVSKSAFSLTNSGYHFVAEIEHNCSYLS